jgi:hypothetical protein
MCGGDADLRGEVESLLAAHKEPKNVLRTEGDRLREENVPNKHFMTALTKGVLGECLTTQQRCAEAETLLQASYNDLKSSQQEQNPRTILARQRLMKLYDAWGKQSKRRSFNERCSSGVALVEDTQRSCPPSRDVLLRIM